MKFASLFIALFLVTATINASEVLVEGKVYNPSAGYFSVLQGEFKITYINQNTNYGDKVFLKYGYSGGYSTYSQTNHWAQEQKIEMPAVSDYQWSIHFEDEVASRGSFSYNYLDFVIVVTDAYGNEKIIDNGTNGQMMSFYRMDLAIGDNHILRNFYTVKP